MDETEVPRKILVKQINTVLSEDKETRRQQLVDAYGEDDVWTTDEVTKEFVVEGFMAPYTLVRRRSDGVKGTLMFSHSPRFYFGFEPSD